MPPRLSLSSPARVVGLRMSVWCKSPRLSSGTVWFRLAIARAAMPAGSAQHTCLASPWRLLLAPPRPGWLGRHDSVAWPADYYVRIFTFPLLHLHLIFMSLPGSSIPGNIRGPIPEQRVAEVAHF